MHGEGWEPLGTAKVPRRQSTRQWDLIPQLPGTDTANNLNGRGRGPRASRAGILADTMKSAVRAPELRTPSNCEVINSRRFKLSSW